MKKADSLSYPLPPNTHLSVKLRVFKGKVSLGEVRLPAGRALAEGDVFGLPAGAELPAVVAFCNGDARLRQRYEGSTKGEALRKWIGEYEGGRKCSAAVPLDASTDFRALSAKVLKGMVKAHGVECKGAAEKDDFVACLEAHIKAGEEKKKDEL